MPNILLTSVGRRVELVRSFRSVYTEFGLSGEICGTDIDWLAPAMHFVDSAHLIPRTDTPGFVPAILKICKDHAIDLVLPLIDPDIPRLAAHQEAIESTGAKLAVVDTAAAEIASDKWLASRFFEQHGLPAPQSWLPEQLPREHADFPLFIKPRGGSAGEHTYCAHDPAEMEWLLRRVPNPIIQEFLPGPEVTCDVVCDLKGNVMAIVPRQRLAVRGGVAIKSVTVSSLVL
jgi:carbamoyl-phosphate synthase large subunit